MFYTDITIITILYQLLQLYDSLSIKRSLVYSSNHVLMRTILMVCEPRQSQSRHDILRQLQYLHLYRIL